MYFVLKCFEIKRDIPFDSVERVVVGMDEGRTIFAKQQDGDDAIWRPPCGIMKIEKMNIKLPMTFTKQTEQNNHLPCIRLNFDVEIFAKTIHYFLLCTHSFN